MKICVTGANGFVGSALCRHLLSKRYCVVPGVRHKSAPWEVEIGDLVRNKDLISILKGCDTLVHLAARVHVMRDKVTDPLAEFRRVNVEGMINLSRQAAMAGVRRFVFISSIKVNGELTAPGEPFRVESLPNPCDPYAISKYEAEQNLLDIAQETGMETVIIRPPLVYGPGVKGNFASLVSYMQRGLPLPLGAVHNQRSFIALENLVDFIALCADSERSPNAANKIFLISDGKDLSTANLLRKVGRAYGFKPRLLPVPVSWICSVASLLGRRAEADRLVGSLVVDISKACELLEWKPVVSMDEQLQKMALYESIL